MEVLNASKKSHFIINGILFDITIFLVIMSAFICLSPTLGLPEAFLSWPPFTVIFTSVFGNIDFTTGPQILSHGATSTRNSMYIQTTSVSGGSWQKHHVSPGRVGSVPFSYILPRWGRESPVGEPMSHMWCSKTTIRDSASFFPFLQMWRAHSFSPRYMAFHRDPPHQSIQSYCLENPKKVLCCDCKRLICKCKCLSPWDICMIAGDHALAPI